MIIKYTHGSLIITNVDTAIHSFLQIEKSYNITFWQLILKSCRVTETALLLSYGKETEM